MMKRSNLFLVAILSELIALGFFLAWASQTDWLFGHTQGPGWLLTVAGIFVIAAVVASVAWFIKLMSGKKQEDESGKRWKNVLCGLSLAPTFLFCGFCLIGSIANLRSSVPEDIRQREAEQQAEIEESVNSLADLQSLVDALNDKQATNRTSALSKLKNVALYQRTKLSDQDRQLFCQTLSTIMLDREGSQDMRAAAADVLNSMDIHASCATSELMDALEDPYFQVRLNAIYALMSIGGDSDEAAKEVIPALKAMQDDPNDKVRSYTKIAIRYIEVTRRTRLKLKKASEPAAASGKKTEPAAVE